MEKKNKAITSQEEDYSQWYNDLVRKAGLADNSPVRGCMVIKPYGFSIWERMQQKLDSMFKETGHTNAYFPLFIPKSFLSREAAHVDGFAKECAVVTHYRLINNPDGDGVVVDPEARLEEELIVRPTSETIIWSTYRDWIQSYRDLPLLINQWANVVRWEMRPRLFLRTAEFLWQEGHTAHATREEAIEETEKMLEVYARFAEEYLAIPVIKGIKSENERFPGAEETYCIEAMMQDGKALQAGTSHFLGQNFARAFDVKFLNSNGREELVWATSWGVSTRLMGALIMTHSDDYGLVLPPTLAPYQVVIVPVGKAADLPRTREAAHKLSEELKERGIRVQVDLDDKKSPGWKYAEYEMRGVPVRVVIGPRDLDSGTVELARRDERSKEIVEASGLVDKICDLLPAIQKALFDRALKMREERTREINSWDEFQAEIEKGGFLSCHWDGTPETEEAIKDKTKATIRCIPLDDNLEDGVCVYSGKPSTRRVIFARAY